MRSTERWENDNGERGGALFGQEAVCATLATTNLTWTGLGSNQRPAVINRRSTHLSHRSYKHKITKQK
jgi:hypothetical protein